MLNDVPRRGDIWSTDAGISVLVISSTVYNEIPSEPTVVVVPVFNTEPDTGFGVDPVRLCLGPPSLWAPQMVPAAS